MAAYTAEYSVCVHTPGFGIPPPTATSRHDLDMQAPTPDPDAAPAAAAARTTGLDTPFKSVGGASKKRAAPVMTPLRTGKIWARDTEGEVSGSCIHTIHSSVGG